ncbi:Uncharacterised protein [Moellerella wisconsensis]|nr:Uncharacterised protein [Moellerella wisconsensis]
MGRKSFTPEFKQECVELVIRQARGIKLNKQVKQAVMDVDLSTLQRWLRQYRGEQKELLEKMSLNWCVKLMDEALRFKRVMYYESCQQLMSLRSV